jgi:hypothetical protein
MVILINLYTATSNLVLRRGEPIELLWTVVVGECYKKISVGMDMLSGRVMGRYRGVSSGMPGGVPASRDTLPISAGER